MTHDPSSPSHSTALPTVRVVPLRWRLPLALVFTPFCLALLGRSSATTP